MKKGMNPLIATVLLIGFVLAVIVLIVLWGQGLLTSTIQKTGDTSAGKLSCQFDIDLEIHKAECSSENDGQIIVDAQSLISKDIPNLRARIVGSTGISTSFSGRKLPSFTRDTFISFAYDPNPTSGVGIPETIEIIPMVSTSAGLVSCDTQSIKVVVGNLGACFTT